MQRSLAAPCLPVMAAISQRVYLSVKLQALILFGMIYCMKCTPPQGATSNDFYVFLFAHALPHIISLAKAIMIQTSFVALCAHECVHAM